LRWAVDMFFCWDEAKPYLTKRIGTDYCSEAVEHAKKYADAIYQGGLVDLNDAEGFDCIILNQVIEHVY